MPQLLSDAAIEEALSALAGWRREGKALRRDLKFADFSSAFGFMARVALAAETVGHHPDWSNSYNRVSITLETHDASGITEKDLALARAIDKIAGSAVV